MRIALNATCFNNRASGAKNRFVGIYEEVFRRMTGDEFYVYEPRDCKISGWFSDYPNVHYISTPLSSDNPFQRHVRGRFFWGRELRRLKPDIFETSYLPLVKSPVGRTVLTIHDIRYLRFPDLYPFRDIVGRMVLSSALEKSDFVVTVSHAMREELVNFFPDAKVGVIYNGIDIQPYRNLSEADLDGVRQRFRLGDRFLLSVGHLEKRKNYPRLLEALDRLRKSGHHFQLVIVGNEADGLQPIHEKIQSLELSDRVRVLRNLSDHEVRCLYRLCSLFVFPSIYEGFGIPVLEAMAARRPMVLSDLPVFREITENQSSYFNEFDPRLIAEAILKVSDSEAEQKRLVEYGARRVAAFEYRKLAGDLEEFYRQEAENAQAAGPLAVPRQTEAAGKLASPGGPAAAPAGRKLKVMFAIKSLHNMSGGAERVLTEVTSGLVERGHDVSIVSFDSPGGRAFYPLHPAVRWIPLAVGRAHRPATFRETLHRMVSLRSTVVRESPQVVVGFMNSMFMPLGIAMIGTGVPVIASEHTVCNHYRRRPLELFLLQFVPYLTKRMVVVSRSAQISFNAKLQRHMTIVPNPVNINASAPAAAPVDGDRKTLLSVGRLSQEKDHKTLIEAFALVAADFPQWDLRIVGDGELRAELESLIERLKLGARVCLAGTTPDVMREYRQATIFAMSSRYESFGLATAEALASGVAVIGFADCPGTNELIQDGQNGLLVHGGDRVAGMASGLLQLMDNPNLRRRLAAAGPASVARFSKTQICTQWENTLSECVFSA